MSGNIGCPKETCLCTIRSCNLSHISGNSYMYVSTFFWKFVGTKVRYLGRISFYYYSPNKFIKAIYRFRSRRFFCLYAFDVRTPRVFVVGCLRLVAGIGTGIVHFGTRHARPLRTLATVIALNSYLLLFLALRPLVREWGTFLRAAAVA